MKRHYLILSAVLSVFILFSWSGAQTAPAKPVITDPGYNVGDLVEAADYRGVWYKSKITEVDNGKYHVHFFGWDSAWDEWVGPDKVRTSDDLNFAPEAEVTRNGVWYKALILDSRYGTEHLVAYLDLNEEEWVKDERIRNSGSGWQGTRQGRIVEVADGKKWRKATILKRRYKEVYVHYEGFDDVWNEWISEDKIRHDH